MINNVNNSLEESQLTLSEISLNDKIIKLLKPLILNMKIEKGLGSTTYILEHEELGLFAIQKSLNRAIMIVQQQFSELWKDYMEYSEDELTIGAKRFRNKILSYIGEYRIEEK